MPKPKPQSPAAEDALVAAFNARASALERIKRLKDEIALLEKELDLSEKLLLASIPPDSSKSNIFHKRTYGKSVSYAKVLEALKDRVIPKTKLPEVAVIVDAFTTTYERHDFKLEA